MPSVRKIARNDEDKKIGLRLRIARVEGGFTQAQIAEMFGVSCQQYQKFETGTNRISAKALHHIAEQLNRPFGWFFEGLKEDKVEEFELAKPRYSFTQLALQALQKINDEHVQRHVLYLIRLAADMSQHKEEKVRTTTASL